MDLHSLYGRQSESIPQLVRSPYWCAFAPPAPRWRCSAVSTAFTMFASSTLLRTLAQPRIAPESDARPALHWVDQTLGPLGFPCRSACSWPACQ